MPQACRIRLPPAEDVALKCLCRRTDNADPRSRCQVILLSAQGHSAAEIALLTFSDQDAFLFWLERYEADGDVGDLPDW